MDVGNWVECVVYGFVVRGLVENVAFALYGTEMSLAFRYRHIMRPCRSMPHVRLGCCLLLYESQVADFAFTLLALIPYKGCKKCSLTMAVGLLMAIYRVGVDLKYAKHERSRRECLEAK